MHNKDLTQLAYAILHIPMVLILLGQCFYCMKEPKCKKLLCEKSSHAMLDPCSLFFLLLFIPHRLVTNLNKKKNCFKSFHHTMF